MNEEKLPASQEFATTIGAVLKEESIPDRRLEAIDREIEMIYENLRDYLAAEDEVALQDARAKAAFEVYRDKKSPQDELADALAEHKLAQEARAKSDVEASRLREESSAELYRLRVLFSIRAFVESNLGQ